MTVKDSETLQLLQLSQVGGLNPASSAAVAIRELRSCHCPARMEQLSLVAGGGLVVVVVVVAAAAAAAAAAVVEVVDVAVLALVVIAVVVLVVVAVRVSPRLVSPGLGPRVLES